MIKKLIGFSASLNTLLVASVLISGVVCISIPHVAVAQGSNDPSKIEACNGAGLPNCQQAAGSITVQGVLKLALNLLSIAAGIIAVVMIIVGGVKYVTSQGEASQTASAKNTILYAVIGLVVAALAQVIVRFVLSRTAKAK